MKDIKLFNKLKVVSASIINNAYLYSIVAKVISVISGFVYSIIYSRYLGAELRGDAAVINNSAEIIILVLCLGIYQAYPYFKRKSKHSIYMEYINYIFGLLFLIVIGCIAVLLFFHPNKETCAVLILVPLMFSIKELNYVVLIENPRLRNTANIKLDIFDIIFILVLVIFTEANYFWCLVLLIVKQIVYFVIAVDNLKINLLTIRPTLKGIWPYIKFGFIPMLTVFLMEINYKADILMLDYFKIPNADVGVYSLGVSLAQKVWMIPDALKDILLSKLADGKDESEVCKITRISILIAIIFLLGMFIFGKPFLNLLYGGEYANAYQVLLLISSGILGMVFYKMIYSYNVINGYKNVNFALLGIAAVVNILFNAILIPVSGMFGAALASTVSYSFCGIGFLLFFHKKTGAKIRDLILINKNDIYLLRSLIANR